MVKFVDKTNLVLELYKKAVKEALTEVGIKGTAEIQLNAPVKTGALRRSYTFNVELSNLSVIIGTALDYSVYVEFKPINAGGRPHFRRSLEEKKEDFKKIFERKLGEINV